MTTHKECRRCGKCCYYPFDGNRLKKCRFLIRLPSGLTFCRIYNNRLGVLIGVGKTGIRYTCHTIEHPVVSQIVGCAYYDKNNKKKDSYQVRIRGDSGVRKKIE